MSKYKVLKKQFLDIKADHKFINTGLILLTETWLSSSQAGGYDIDDYSANFNNAGHGKGIASYARDMFSHQKKISQKKVFKYQSFLTVN